MAGFLISDLGSLGLAIHPDFFTQAQLIPATPPKARKVERKGRAEPAESRYPRLERAGPLHLISEDA